MTDENQQQPQLSLDRIYLKDASFEVPNGAKAFTADWQPEVDINLQTAAEQLDETHYQVTLSVTVNAKNAGNPAFVAEVHQAGIFTLVGIPAEQMGHVLGAYCPNILFPFVREAINDLVCKGSFPSLLLQPINFDAAYQDNLEHQQEAAQATGNA